VEEILKRNPDPKLRVLVVWEPMLFMDLRAPNEGKLARISDGRVRHFWDPGHLVALELKRRRAARPGQPEPNCCENSGIYWDDALVFPAHTKWKDVPAAIFWDGTIWRVAPELEKAIQSALR
jgi:hypothetical protein